MNWISLNTLYLSSFLSLLFLLRNEDWQPIQTGLCIHVEQYFTDRCSETSQCIPLRKYRHSWNAASSIKLVYQCNCCITVFKYIKLKLGSGSKINQPSSGVWFPKLGILLMRVQISTDLIVYSRWLQIRFLLYIPFNSWKIHWYSGTLCFVFHHINFMIILLCW